MTSNDQLCSSSRDETGAALAVVMRRMGRAWRDAAHLALAAHDLTLLQWALLELVCERPGSSQVELARTMGIEGASLVRVLDSLERQGWVARAPDAKDRRVNRVHPKDTAADRMRAACRAIEGAQARAVSRMSERDRAAFVRLMGLAVEGLTAVPAEAAKNGKAARRGD